MSDDSNHLPRFEVLTTVPHFLDLYQDYTIEVGEVEVRLSIEPQHWDAVDWHISAVEILGGPPGSPMSQWIYHALAPTHPLAKWIKDYCYGQRTDQLEAAWDNILRENPRLRRRVMAS